MKAALLIVAGLLLVLSGLAGATLANPPTPEQVAAPVPATVVVVNSGWVPEGGSSNAGPHTPPAAPALPAATSPVLFSADFSTDDLAAWTNSPLCCTTAPALWQVRNGLLRQAGDTTLQLSAEEAYLLTGPTDWRDVNVEASVFATSGEDAGLVWRAQGASFYRLRLLPNLPNTAPKAQLDRVQHGQVTTVAGATLAAYAGYSATAWQTVRVQAVGDHHQVWVNGTLLFDLHDATLAQGQVGLYAWADSGTYFDNMRVQRATTP